MRPTRELAKSCLFQQHPEDLPIDDRIRVSYERAKQVGRAYALTPYDLLTLSPKFWELHTDPIWTMDGAACTLVTLQYNCCAGTLAMFAAKQPDLNGILQEVLHFDVTGQFCLTEVGHGLDVIHLETTATRLESGEFELNTPNESAAKYMPPTTPIGIPCVAIVFARTIVRNEDYGVKPFVLRLHDGTEMTPGVISKLLPQRGGARPINHSLTYFHHPRLSFFANIARVAVGTLALGSIGIPALQVSSFIAARYSLRRTVIDSEGHRRPIISFQTQKVPIVTALAQSFVMQAMHVKAVSIFRDLSQDNRVRHAIASILKVVMIQHGQAAHIALGDRCGAQGLFEVNQLAAMHADMRGSAIAEGDLLVISIRLATELLLGRYAIPNTTNPTSLLARHEQGMFDELHEVFTGMDNHRGPEYNRSILPECLPLVQAIGHRMAYDAAVEANVDTCLVNLYEASCVKLDSAWYVEKTGLSRLQQKEMEADSVDAVFSRLEEYLSMLDVEPYVSAPLISDDKWEQYVQGLREFGGVDKKRAVPDGHGPPTASVAVPVHPSAKDHAPAV